jgi:hypothetical protein
MFYFTKTQFFRVTLIATAVMCHLQPAFAATVHHTPKIKHVRHIKKIAHNKKPTLTHTKKTRIAAADNIQFTVGANSTIVANNVVIPPAPIPATTPEETGIEILSEAPASLSEGLPIKPGVPAPQNVVVNMLQPVVEEVRPAEVAATAKQEPTLATTAPRNFFQFHNIDSGSATVSSTTSQSIPPSQATTTDQPHGFFVFHKVTDATPAPQVVVQTPVSRGFFDFIHQENNPPRPPANTPAPQAVAETAAAHGFFLFHKSEPSVPAQSVSAAAPAAQQLSPAPQRRFFQFHRDAGAPAKVTVSVTTTTTTQARPSRLGYIAASMHKHIVDFVKNTVATLRYSDYKLGGSKFDTSKGIYVVDCSNFVDQILKEVSPHAYTSLVNATGAPTPATQHYYEFFKELSNNSDDYWNKINNVEQLRAGDILVFRTKNSRHGAGAGHVMVIMEKPTKDMGVYFVRVADSAPARHSEDTRQRNEGGIGIGTLLLKTAKSGRPSAYAWGVGGYWNKNVNFAMARPTEWN